MARRLRTHTNPLSYPKPITRNDWTCEFEDDKPIIVDLGSGKGDFIIETAKHNPNHNHIGIEVRPSMVEEFNKKEENPDNVICLQGNASISLRTMFEDNEISEYHINFPDPWFKERHKKRRMIKEDVITDLYDTLKNDGVIFLMTDVKELFDEFKSHLCTKFKETSHKETEIKSYWEKWHEKNNNPVYRTCFKK